MRIAQIAPLTDLTPTEGNGAIESVIPLLTDELVKRGHDVVLFAAEGTPSAADRRGVSRHSFRGLGRPEVMSDLAHVIKAFRSAADCDVIHNHQVHFGLALQSLVPTPVLTTLHRPFDPGVAALSRHFEAAPCVALSQAHRRSLPAWLNVTQIIPHGLPLERFPFQAAKEDFLLFMGSLHPSQGAHLAIEAAQAARLPLVIAGTFDRYSPEHWETMIRPHVDGRAVFFTATATFAEKVSLLRRARALLFPVQREEPFGLVTVEAAACGTPVVALRRGAVPELVVEGETGFIAETASGMLYGIRHAHQIDPRRCRREVERRFTIGDMVDRYLAAYAVTPGRPGVGPGLPDWAADAMMAVTGELAAFFDLPWPEARQRLADAPALLAEAWWRQMPTGADSRAGFLGREPLWVFERARQSLELGSRQGLADAAEAAGASGLRRWLSYRSDIGDLGLAIPEGADVLEPAGPVHDFIAWRLRQRGLAGRMLEAPSLCALPEATYDGILACGGLELEPDPAATLASLVRVLRPGGLLLLRHQLLPEIDQPWVAPAYTGRQKRFEPAAYGLEPLAARGASCGVGQYRRA